MRMIAVKLNGQTVHADLLNPKVMRKVREGFNETLEKFNKGAICQDSEEGVIMQCTAVIDYVTDIFGKEEVKKVFGEETDLLTCMDVMEEMFNLYKDQVNPIIAERVKKLDLQLETKEVEI